ncbi:MAG: UDP-N-acetylglucosamine 4,6-dehydratase (inverting) [Rhodospirillales bacterium]|nr:UDP-N-acetylglucosamine 4,6-dehydratase (inverting) [Rhodospirillales bacterium]
MTKPTHTFEQPVPDLNGKIILVTGGTGSFGKAFIKTVTERYKPKKAIIFSRDELKQHDMQQDPDFQGQPSLRFFIGDVRDRDRLEMAMREVDYVIHAAALKHVPTAEYNPMECINTNVIGAENVVRAALRSGVKKVIALSTDKAANPVNLYGASKLASDKIFIAANNLSGQDGTRFSVVRYGNVLGSRGSVIPFFEKLIAEKADSMPITDDRMTRFWITLDQGINFVLSSLEMMKGGEIYVPKIPSMKMTDMAEAMAPGVPHCIVGIRPGEKLHEVMITSDDARNTIEYDDRYTIMPAFNFWSEDDGMPQGAKPVDENFIYSSDTNTEWLAPDDLMRLSKG